ncbi:hypothetical protein K9M78_01105 [Candidatus Bipolaricaulota bacterium]|nr:hypothetical protein [Candidatus Bipolaricaulota bacterium]
MPFIFSSLSYKRLNLLVLALFIATLTFTQTVGARTIQFSGYTWEVKNFTEYKRGPGPNYFSDNERNVWVDAQGNLHLRIEKREGKWHCAEVYLKKDLGYGLYTFTVREFKERFDPNAVLGLFVYEGKNREIDVEVSYWGDLNRPNATFALQPTYLEGHKDYFEVGVEELPIKFGFRWKPNRIAYWANASEDGTRKQFAKPEYSWSHSHLGYHVPTERDLKTHINLWLFKGEPPEKQEEIEVVIEKFEFESF